LSKGKVKEDMKKEKKPPKSKNGKTPEAQCSRCLGQLHSKRLCPARESKCNKSSKVGHWVEGKVEGEFFLGELTELSAGKEVEKPKFFIEFH